MDEGIAYDLFGFIDFFDVPKKTADFLTYHGFLTIATSSRIISRDII
jgi:hypothetical protein